MLDAERAMTLGPQPLPLAVSREDLPPGQTEPLAVWQMDTAPAVGGSLEPVMRACALPATPSRAA